MQLITDCPHLGCGTPIDYTPNGAPIYGGLPTCTNGHRFRHYTACGGLLPVGDDYRPSGPMFVAEPEVVRLLDVGARLWNTLCWYTSRGDNRRFWGRLIKLMHSIGLEREAQELAQQPGMIDALRYAQGCS